MKAIIGLDHPLTVYELDLILDASDLSLGYEIP